MLNELFLTEIYKIKRPPQIKKNALQRVPNDMIDILFVILNF